MGDYDEGWIDGLPPESEKEAWLLVQDIWRKQAIIYGQRHPEQSGWWTRRPTYFAHLQEIYIIAWQPLSA